MSQLYLSLKRQAVDILMTAIFSHTRQLQHEAYVRLAQENARLRKVQANHFTYIGEVFPKKTANGTSIQGVQVNAPPLHVTLFEEFQTAQSVIETAGYNQVKNFLSGAFTVCYNEAMLSELLPAVLINKLKGEMGADAFQLAVYSTDTYDRDGVAKNKQHYAKTIDTIRILMMENLLHQE